MLNEHSAHRGPYRKGPWAQPHILNLFYSLDENHAQAGAIRLT